ncbi:hypothetical protein EYF80_033039 [Liparis tanakae]|uniref:Uncharacterized protein n=1 Tax=Liparis tanakae TaxID=230148 RepID=A0A4Z2GTW5_9TELE|nr:hypothetical protein EYF80_033039 [Liparis tanakae]
MSPTVRVGSNGFWSGAAPGGCFLATDRGFHCVARSRSPSRPFDFKPQREKTKGSLESVVHRHDSEGALHVAYGELKGF